MLYSLSYRLKNQIFWRTIKNVAGDHPASDLPVATRVVMLADNTRLEIPMDGTLFKFSPERFELTKQFNELNNKNK